MAIKTGPKEIRMAQVAHRTALKENKAALRASRMAPKVIKVEMKANLETAMKDCRKRVPMVLPVETSLAMVL